ncbi:MAG: transaldolase [Betaproteobacteria bacterium RBG_16_64_18]|nr:MAG: transaldolase [Betaproteobacteria bacterium RBG_16_64_18]OGA16777.1 MAG: transaldolase [Betaproteobacteria bacterium RIFCSPLOWO2_02_FULL_65_20]
MSAKKEDGNLLRRLGALGQSVWLDYIRRDLIESGGLARLVRDDGVRGVTSNPSIFEKAISGSRDYAGLIADASRQGRSAKAIYEQLAIRDIRDAADVLRTVHAESGARDGFVSLEVSPVLANDTEGTVDEARRLWREVGRGNLMIKVPGTPAGIPAIRALIGDGINVNVTLLFSQAAYEQAAEAYVSGLEALAGRGGNLGGVASVASFFVSRIDTAIDAELERKMAGSADAGLAGLRGRAAIANAKLAYRIYRDIVAGDRWRALAAKGAQPQRLLWASTSTKNPNYRDVIYVEELVGRDTVNTIPPATLDAFRDHGRVRESLVEDLDAARQVFAELQRQGISFAAVTDRLLDEGVKLFADAFEKLLAAVAAEAGSAKA